MNLYIEFIALSVSVLLMIQQGKSDYEIISFTYFWRKKSINKIFFTFIENVVVISGTPSECYTSNGQTKKSNDDGVLYECRMEAGATIRKCLKFTRGVYQK